MAKHKAAINCQVLPWLSAKLDCREGRFLQTGNSLFLSKKFQELSSGAQMTYLCMAMESGGKRDFVFTHTTAKKYGIPPRTLDRHIKELADKKFISVSSGKNTRTANEFEFLFAWKYEETDVAHGNISCISTPKWRSANGEKVSDKNEIMRFVGNDTTPK